MIHEELESIEARLNDADYWGSVIHHVPALIAEVKRLTRERDAAVADMRRISVNNGEDRWYKCNFCTSSCSEELAYCEHWQWRGVREADNA